MEESFEYNYRLQRIENLGILGFKRKCGGQDLIKPN